MPTDTSNKTDSRDPQKDNQLKWGNIPLDGIYRFNKHRIDKGTYSLHPVMLGDHWWLVLEPALDSKLGDDSKPSYQFKQENHIFPFISGCFKDGYFLASCNPNVQGHSFEIKNCEEGLLKKWKETGSLVAIKVEGHKQLQKLHDDLKDHEVYLTEDLNIITQPQELPEELKPKYEEEFKLQVEEGKETPNDEGSQKLRKLGYSFYTIKDDGEVDLMKNKVHRQGGNLVHIRDAKADFDASAIKTGSNGSSNGSSNNYKGSNNNRSGGGYFTPAQRAEWINNELHKCGIDTTSALSIVATACESKHQWNALQYLIAISGSHTPNFVNPLSDSEPPFPSDSTNQEELASDSESEADDVTDVGEVGTAQSNNGADTKTTNGSNEETDTETSNGKGSISQFSDLPPVVRKVKDWIDNYDNPDRHLVVPDGFVFPDDVLEKVGQEDLEQWCNHLLSIINKQNISHREFKAKLKHKCSFQRRFILAADLDEISRIDQYVKNELNPV